MAKHRTEQQFIKLLTKLPEHLHPLIARILWWDHVDKKMQGSSLDSRVYPKGMPILKAAGRHFEIGREEAAVTEEELCAALIACGYSAKQSRKRAYSYAHNHYVAQPRLSITR